MKVRFTKQVGDMNFEIEEEAQTQADIFDVVEFWSSLPSTGPGGETDLRFAHRVAQGYDFYEIVSEKADQRFCYGQRKEGKGRLYPKEWEPIYHGSDEGGSCREDDRQQSRPQPVERRPAQSGNQNVDTAIRAEFQRLGITNAGQEKTIVMKALNSKVGIPVAELNAPEKADLLDWLQRQEARRAA